MVAGSGWEAQSHEDFRVGVVLRGAGTDKNGVLMMEMMTMKMMSCAVSRLEVFHDLFKSPGMQQKLLELPTDGGRKGFSNILIFLKLQYVDVFGDYCIFQIIMRTYGFVLTIESGWLCVAI